MCDAVYLSSKEEGCESTIVGESVDDLLSLFLLRYCTIKTAHPMTLDTQYQFTSQNSSRSYLTNQFGYSVMLTL